ncbi:hypothetical protein [Streptomyces catenulae]|uniref:Uncharacterized protein n=1 Tax=Streptomyces catenulae TaxID=66875 RepID=A0ABV2YU63_9ACTN|nr:hypothetical protein [Streptomyces catenulae]
MLHGQGEVSEMEGGAAECHEVRASLIALHVDQGNFDFHITAMPGYRASEMRRTLALAKSQGLILPDEEDREPELLEDGSVRLHLIPAAKI